VQIHAAVGFGVIALVGGGSVGAIVSLLRQRSQAALRIYLRITTAAIALEVAIGIGLVATGGRPQQVLHWLYGAAMLLALPLAMAVGRRLGGREERVWLAGGAVLTLLFALRALATG
jgi:hypothetical protein